MADAPRISPELQEVIAKARLMDEIAARPELKGDLLRLVKKFNPDAPIPEIDIPDAFEQRLEAERKERARVEARLDAREKADREKAERAYAQEHGLNEEGEKEVRKLMEDKGITKFESAVDHYALTRAAARPTRPLSDTTFELPASVDFKSLWTNPTHWARQEAGKAIAEFRR